MSSSGLFTFKINAVPPLAFPVILLKDFWWQPMYFTDIFNLFNSILQIERNASLQKIRAIVWIQESIQFMYNHNFSKGTSSIHK